MEARMAICISRRIRNVYPNLSSGHKKIANIVLREPSKAQHYSCIRLANKAGVSSSTVNRFAKLVGYDSFNEFRNAITQELADDMSDSEKLVTPTDETRTRDLAKKTLAMDIKNLRYTMEHLDLDDIKEFVEFTLKERRKFIIGFGNDAAIAKMLYDNFVKMFDNVNLITDYEDYFALICSLTKYDQVIVFSVADVSDKLQGLMRFIKSKNPDITIISNDSSSPIFEYANRFFEAKAETPTFAHSLASAVSIVNAITLEIVKVDRVRITERHKMLEKLRADYSK
jgi:DNA-binding MurR/RpiR family transcriptional regulator